MKKQSVQHWKMNVEPVLASKKKEFNVLGVQEVTKDDIWDCLLHQVWKKDQKKKLHEVVQDIFHLKVSTYMNHVRVAALQTDDKEDDLLASIDALSK